MNVLPPTLAESWVIVKISRANKTAKQTPDPSFPDFLPVWSNKKIALKESI
jgi:hypothetical protein